jgi:hypothetical protein
MTGSRKETSMKMKQILLVGAATMALSMPAMAAEMGDMTGTSSVTGGTKTMPTATTNAPQTGPNSTAIPEVPSAGTANSAATDDGTTGTINKDGGASATDLQHQLTTKGYSMITPTGNAGATTSGETRFNATNSDGKKVQLTVNANTGEMVKETPAE